MADERTLLLANTPWDFWRLLDEQITVDDWCNAAEQASCCFAGLPASGNDGGPLGAISAILGEGQFGPSHWRLGRVKRVYYSVRPLLPAQVRPALRRLLLARQRSAFCFGWPVEDRYVRFQFETLARLLENKGLDSADYVRFWPDGKGFAFVLTHDVESGRGQRFVREVAMLEERLGFRSTFNFVPEDYGVDPALLGELRERGFEVGVHGLKHDGKLFSSRTGFSAKARRINGYLKAWGAVGFRSPLTHRQPQWMQDLEIEYDSSFFDTDPYETIPGGTMSIWPFEMGRFVELPYTLPQDHTLMVTLGETTPRLWLDKVDFIQRHGGLALVITHPDYLQDGSHLAVYEDFLRQMRDRGGFWHALPREVARWWRNRAAAGIERRDGEVLVHGLPGSSIGQVSLTAAGSPA